MGLRGRYWWVCGGGRSHGGMRGNAYLWGKGAKNSSVRARG